MYNDDRTHDVSSQAFIFATPEKNKVSEQAELELDPIGELVWSLAKDLLSKQPHFTIKDIQDNDTTGTKDSVIRTRLGQIVDHGFLECYLGTGRRPSFYFFPKTKNKSEIELLNQEALEIEPLTNEALLIAVINKELAISQQIEELQAKLLTIANDKAAIQRTIELQQNFVNDGGI